jgi:hypothetical protein
VYTKILKNSKSKTVLVLRNLDKDTQPAYNAVLNVFVKIILKILDTILKKEMQPRPSAVDRALGHRSSCPSPPMA